MKLKKNNPHKVFSTAPDTLQIKIIINNDNFCFEQGSAYYVT